MVIREVDSKGRMVLPEELRKDKVVVTRLGNQAVIVPVENPYKSLRGKISAPPLEELRERTEKRLSEETEGNSE